MQRIETDTRIAVIVLIATSFDSNFAIVSSSLYDVLLIKTICRFSEHLLVDALLLIINRWNYRHIVVEYASFGNRNEAIFDDGIICGGIVHYSTYSLVDKVLGNQLIFATTTLFFLSTSLSLSLIHFLSFYLSLSLSQLSHSFTYESYQNQNDNITQLYILSFK